MIACAGCGRSYPAERFAEGRSLHCACGSRVGRRVDTGVPLRAGPPRFLADVMLGGLARWLRASGHDAEWEPQIDDPELVRRGVAEQRWILTRDRRLAEEWWIDSLILLHSDAPLAQLEELHRRLGLRPHRPFSRCTRCNRELIAAPPGRLGELPADVRRRGADALECPSCHRLYWQGSHTHRMRRTLERALGGG